MTLSTAITEIRAARPTTEPERRLLFKRQQHALDELIDQAETLVMNRVARVPRWLEKRADLVLGAVFGEGPPRRDGVTAPEAFLDQLFTAEGMLRRSHYRTIHIDLDDGW